MDKEHIYESDRLRKAKALKALEKKNKRDEELKKSGENQKHVPNRNLTYNDTSPKVSNKTPPQHGWGGANLILPGEGTNRGF